MDFRAALYTPRFNALMAPMACGLGLYAGNSLIGATSGTMEEWDSRGEQYGYHSVRLRLAPRYFLPLWLTPFYIIAYYLYSFWVLRFAGRRPPPGYRGLPE